MPQRRPAAIIALLTLVVLGAVAVGLVVARRDRTSTTSSQIAATPQRPRPTVPASPTAPLIVTRPSSPLPDDIELPPPPTLDELLARHPQMAILRPTLDLSDRAQLARVYEQLVTLYRDEGALALDTYMVESGALQSLNLDPAYLDFVLAYESGGPAAAEALAARRRLLSADGQVRAVLLLAADDLSAIEPALIAAGATVLGHHGNEVEIALPLAPLAAATSAEEALARLVALAHQPPVLALRAPAAVPVEALSPFDQGAAVTLATAWHAAGFTGQGIKVGIIDPEGFAGYQDLLGSELPPADHVFIPSWANAATLNAVGEGHGTACAEVVHDMAPDASLYLVYSGTGGSSLARAVDWFIANDVDVITHSAASLVEPLDGTSPDAQDVARAEAAGILWVNSAGNYAQAHLNMVFTDADGDGYHEFPDGNELLPIYVADHVSLGLSWDEPWQRAGQNYDLYVYTRDYNGQPVMVASSRLAQSGRAADQPFELLDLQLWPYMPYYAVIRQTQTTRPGRLNLVGWGMEFAYSMPAGSLGAPADAFGALAVGATHWRDDALEGYSSQGPTSDGRTKPDLTAPVWVTTATYVEGFYGTSAAAPHVAGAAALALGAYPDLDVRGLRDFLTSRALDIGAPGPDNVYGAGRLDMQQPPSAVVRGASVATTTINGVRLAQDQAIGGARGVVVYTDFSVAGLSDLTGTIVARFSYADSRPLLDGNGQYADDAGGVAVSAAFQAIQPGGQSREYELFMPYAELELPPGEHTILVTVTLYDAAGNLLDVGAPLAMVVGQADNRPHVTFTGPLHLRHSVAHDGLIGIDILVNFDALNFAGQTATMAAYFYYDDANNTPLRDFNQQFVTWDGIVAVGRRFTPGTAESPFRDFVLFMPYGELHAAPGARYTLKLRVVVWDETTGETLGMSDWAAFWYES